MKSLHRHQKNMMEGLEDSSGSWQVSLEAVKEIVLDYFSTLFTTSNPTNIERVTDTVQAVVFEPMNQLLSRDFQSLEVHQALK